MAKSDAVVDAIEAEADVTIRNFFQDLLSNQSELSEEFEIILYDNLWNLYEE